MAETADRVAFLSLPSALGVFLVVSTLGGVVLLGAVGAGGGVPISDGEVENPAESADVATGHESLMLSRTETIVNTPVTLAAEDETETDDWQIEGPDGPVDIREGRAGVVSVQPPSPGAYEVSVETDDGTASATFEAREQTAVLAEYAPRLHFHEDGPYRPTRVEALVENARLYHGDRGLVETDPTLFDLVDRDSNYYIELEGSESDYPAFQDQFEPTVYTNYVPDIEFEGEQYDMLHYWFIYTNDPKHSFARFEAHQGDVEWTTILLDMDGDPAYAIPAAHGGRTAVPYDQFAEDGRLDLYPEHRSHATYLRDSTVFDGNDFQVYEFWNDGGAACGDVANFESTFYSEWTGSDETWSPDGEAGIEYQLVELDGGEVWASYEGGFNNRPGSISGPHTRDRFEAADGTISADCHDHETVTGSLSVDSLSETDGEWTADVTVANEGGKPHEFWVSVEEDGVQEAEPVRVGTSRWQGFPGENSTTLAFETDSDTFDIELWLHPPETRQSYDHEDTVSVEDGNPVDSAGVPLVGTVLAGVLAVVVVSYLFERRRY